LKELTPEEQALVERGAAAQSFLSNPAMASAINELSETLANAILTTALDEFDKRDRFYNLHVALKELVAILNHRVALKQNIEAQMEDDTENS
jgi:hypothetical protein